MRKALFIITTVLLSAVLLQSCKPSDEEVKKFVDAVLTATVPGTSASVKNQVVTLTGTVETEEQKTAAESAVRSIKNVKNVMNEIKVMPPRIVVNPDDTLMETISSALRMGGYSTVNVAVRDGEVTLSGDLKRADLQKVMQIADESKPKKVVNNLKLK